jgi:hypothetical protein
VRPLTDCAKTNEGSGTRPLYARSGLAERWSAELSSGDT